MLVATAQRAAELVQTSFPATELLGKSRLEALVASRVALLREWPGLVWFLLSDQAAARIPEGARAGLLELAHKTQHELTTALLAAREAGELRADVAVEAQRTVLLGVVHALARGSGGDPTEILTGVFQLLVPAPNTALPAITTEPPPSS